MSLKQECRQGLSISTKVGKEERNVRNSNPVAYGTGDEEIVGQRVAARSNGHKKGGAPKVVNDSGGVPFVVVGRPSKRQR